jgi:hypothetical protein
MDDRRKRQTFTATPAEPGFPGQARTIWPTNMPSPRVAILLLRSVEEVLAET